MRVSSSRVHGRATSAWFSGTSRVPTSLAGLVLSLIRARASLASVVLSLAGRRASLVSVVLSLVGPRASLVGVVLTLVGARATFAQHLVKRPSPASADSHLALAPRGALTATHVRRRFLRRHARLPPPCRGALSPRLWRPHGRSRSGLAATRGVQTFGPAGTPCELRGLGGCGGRSGHDRVRGPHRHARRHLRCLLRPPSDRRRPGGAHLARHLRSASGLSPDGQAPGRSGVCGPGGQSLRS